MENESVFGGPPDLRMRRCCRKCALCRKRTGGFLLSCPRYEGVPPVFLCYACILRVGELREEKE